MTHFCFTPHWDKDKPRSVKVMGVWKRDWKLKEIYINCHETPGEQWLTTYYMHIFFFLCDVLLSWVLAFDQFVFIVFSQLYKNGVGLLWKHWMWLKVGMCLPSCIILNIGTTTLSKIIHVVAKKKKPSSFPEIPTCYFHVVLYYVPNVSLKKSEDGVFSVNSFA